MATVWSKVLNFSDLVQSHLYQFRLGEGEDLAETKHLQNMNANVSRMSQCSHCYRNGIAEKTTIIMAEPQKFRDALWLNSILKVGCLSETLPVLLDFPHSVQMVLEDFLGTIFYQCILFYQCMPQWLHVVPDGAMCQKCNSKKECSQYRD